MLRMCKQSAPHSQPSLLYSDGPLCSRNCYSSAYLMTYYNRYLLYLQTSTHLVLLSKTNSFKYHTHTIKHPHLACN